MRSPCDPPKFDENDWSQFDFSRWHADGVSGEGTGKAAAEFATQFFQSEEWSSQFKATLPQVKTVVRASYEAEVVLLRQERQEAEAEFKQRIQASEQRASAAAEANQAAAGPVILKATADTFQLGVRVVEDKIKFGLPAMTVRLMDPRDPAKVLQETSTDRDGNAVFVLAPEIAKELDGIHASIQVAAPGGKTVETQSAAICIRLKGTETKIVALKDSPEIAGPKSAAVAAQASNAVQQKHLLGRAEGLKAGLADRLKDIDCRIREVEVLIGQMQETGGPANPSRPAGDRGSDAPAGKKAAAATGRDASQDAKPAARKKPGEKKS